MKRTRRIACLLVVVFVLSQMSFASAFVESVESNTYSDPSCDVYTEKSNSSIMTIVVSVPHSFVELTVRYLNENESDYLYHLMLGTSILQNITAPYGSPEFWKELKAVCMSHINDADKLLLIAERMPIQPLNSNYKDFLKDIKPLHGEEYTKQKYVSHDYSGLIFTVFETLNYFFIPQNNTVASAGLTLASVITTILGIINPTGPILTGVAALLGLASPYASTVIENSQTIQKYLIQAQYMQYVTVNNGNAPYNDTAKTYEYIGYVNLNDTSPAYACPETEEIWYTDSPGYFGNFAAQVEDAYHAYTYF